MRDLIFCISCKPKCEDRRRPPYFERSENAAPIRRSSGRPSILASALFNFFLLGFHVPRKGWLGGHGLWRGAKLQARAAIFRPEGEKRPLICLKRATSH